MMNNPRLVTILETVKNAAIVLGIPAFGVYMWNYHRSQVEIKDSIIALQKVQMSHMEKFSVESTNQRLVSMKNLYEDLLADTSDSLHLQTVRLDSMSRALDNKDSTARQYGNMIILPYDMLVHFAANRSVANELLRECRAENRALQEKLRKAEANGH